jgi:hypothetical protein
MHPAIRRQWNEAVTSGDRESEKWKPLLYICCKEYPIPVSLTQQWQIIKRNKFFFKDQQDLP